MQILEAWGLAGARRLLSRLHYLRKGWCSLPPHFAPQVRLSPLGPMSP